MDRSCCFFFTTFYDSPGFWVPAVDDCCLLPNSLLRLWLTSSTRSYFRLIDLHAMYNDENASSSWVLRGEKRVCSVHWGSWSLKINIFRLFSIAEDDSERPTRRDATRRTAWNFDCLMLSTTDSRSVSLAKCSRDCVASLPDCGAIHPYPMVHAEHRIHYRTQSRG